MQCHANCLQFSGIPSGATEGPRPPEDAGLDGADVRPTSVLVPLAEAGASTVLLAAAEGEDALAGFAPLGPWLFVE